MSNYKDRTNSGLIAIYDTHGMAVTKEVAMKALKSKEHKDTPNMYTDVAGELCETILYLEIVDFMKRNPKETKNWIIGKGLILRDKHNPDSDFMTELDLTLFTAGGIYLFECKSYKGSCTLTEEGILSSSRHNVDVYKQNKLHLNALSKVFDAFRTISFGSGYKMFLFYYADGTVKDTRTAPAKREMPLVTVKNIQTLFEGMLKLDKDKKWDIRQINKAVKILEEKAEKWRAKHLKYVKQLAEERKNNNEH